MREKTREGEERRRRRGRRKDTLGEGETGGLGVMETLPHHRCPQGDREMFLMLRSNAPPGRIFPVSRRRGGGARGSGG